MIRRATEQDFSKLADVENRADQLFSAIPGFENFLAFPDMTAKDYLNLPSSHQTWVYESDTILGLASTYDMDDAIYLAQLSVDPAHQGTGIGIKLLETVCKTARTAHKTGVVLCTFKNIPWNAPFYKNRGFDFLSSHQMGPQLSARAQADHVKWAQYSPRCVMGRFF